MKQKHTGQSASMSSSMRDDGSSPSSLVSSASYSNLSLSSSSILGRSFSSTLWWAISCFMHLAAIKLKSLGTAPIVKEMLPGYFESKSTSPISSTMDRPPNFFCKFSIRLWLCLVSSWSNSISLNCWA